ncbi:MAG TPA: LamG-like jellyroll fold domain-containing protein [Pyrinomonadaceae bacterium]
MHRQTSFLFLTAVAWLTLAAITTHAQSAKPPVLISETNSTRAIALDSVTSAKEPFSLSSLFASDNRTRVMLFALNLENQDANSVTADAETADHQHHDLQVDYVGPVPDLPWLNAVVVRLNDDLTGTGDVLVRITANNVPSNRVRMGIRSIGGGPPDDDGAAPTPAPPYQISGRVLSAGHGLAGVSLVLSGDQSGTVTTDADGFYSFLITSFGSYTLTASKQFFDLAPPTRLFSNLSGNQVDTNFSASRQVHQISGKVFNDESQPMSGLVVVLKDSAGVIVGSNSTDSTGAYSFSNVSAGLNYKLSATPNNIFNFNEVDTDPLSTDLTINFTAIRKTYSLRGTLKNQTNDPIANNSVFLSGFQLGLTESDATGAFVFNNLPAGHDYVLEAHPGPFYTFTIEQSFTNLSSNIDTVFTGTLRKYSISGSVKIGSDPVINQTVILSGTQSSTTTTDNNGNFTFPGLNALGNYQISPAPTALKTFPPQTVTTLGGDQVLSFADVPRKYSITGTIKDSNNTRLSGVRISLSGTETASTRTNLLGQYTINATVLGDYTVTADIEQNYFSFTPSTQTVNSLTGDQVFDFDGTLQPIPNPQQVLEFDGQQKSVDYGTFWPEFTNLGHTFWEFWAMPSANAGTSYLITDGYGGLHSILFGFANFSVSEPNRYQFFGNMNDGVIDANHVVSFGGDQGPAPGEWGHFAVGWDGQNIITYLNGVPVGRTAYARPRQSTGPGTGSGRLLIGGSDHLNFRGRIAQVRGYEGSNPREATSVESSFAPETLFSPDGNLLSWYFVPGAKVADLSHGYFNSAHIGTPRGTATGVLNECPGCPIPQFVSDPTAPNFATNTPSQPAPTPVPVAAPPIALVFDSFSRPNSTYLFGAKGGLGSTESGSAGPQIWQMDQNANQQKPFGILNGVGVILADAPAVSWVTTNSAKGDLDVRTSRKVGGWGSGVSTGLSFRVKDHDNYFFAYTSPKVGFPQIQLLTVGYYFEGFRTTLVSNLDIPQNWTDLRVVTRENGRIQIFLGAQNVYSTTELILSKETKAGLYSNERGMALVNRWDNFGVYPAP